METQPQPQKTSQTNKILVTIVVASLLGALLGFGLSFAAFGSQINSPKHWVQVDHFSGVEDMTIPKIAINADIWKVTWRAMTDSQAYASLALLFKDENGQLVSVTFLQPDDFGATTAGGVNYVVGSGEFTASVLAANLNFWELTVYSYQT
jgi:hypothetical protein